VVENGDNLCKPCAHGSYFKDPKEIAWPDMNWTPPDSRHSRARSQDPGDRSEMAQGVRRTVCDTHQ
jgi:hypothetical protein